MVLSNARSCCRVNVCANSFADSGEVLRSGEQFNESDTATYAQAVCDIFAQESTASQPTRNAAYTSLVKYMDNDSSLAGKIGGILASKKDGKENSLSHILENISEF